MFNPSVVYCWQWETSSRVSVTCTTWWWGVLCGVVCQGWETSSPDTCVCYLYEVMVRCVVVVWCVRVERRAHLTPVSVTCTTWWWGVVVVVWCVRVERRAHLTPVSVTCTTWWWGVLLWCGVSGREVHVRLRDWSADRWQHRVHHGRRDGTQLLVDDVDRYRCQQCDPEQCSLRNIEQLLQYFWNVNCTESFMTYYLEIH